MGYKRYPATGGGGITEPVTLTDVLTSDVAAGSNAIKFANVGARLSLGSDSRYFYDDGSGLAAAGPLTATGNFETLGTMYGVDLNLTGDLFGSGGVIYARDINGLNNDVWVLGDAVDGPSARGVVLGSLNSLSNASAMLVHGLNAGVTAFYITPSGGYVANTPSGEVGFNFGNAGARLALGNSARYLSDNGSALLLTGAVSMSSTLAVSGAATLSSTLAVTSTITASALTAASTASLSLTGSAADGASAVSLILNAGTNLTTSGAKILSIRNNNVEKASVDKDGNFTANIFSATTRHAAPIYGDQQGVERFAPKMFDGTQSNVYTARTTDSATSIAHKFGNLTAYTTAGAKIASFYSDSISTEKAYIDKDGKFFSGGVEVPTLTSTSTLTNKTLTSPTINGAALSGTLSGSPDFSGSPTVGSAAIAVQTAAAPAILTFGYTSGTATTSPQYMVAGAPYTSTSTGSSNRYLIVPFAGTIRNFYVSGHGSDTTSSANATYEIIKNDVATGVTAVMAALTRTASNTSSTVTVAAGDRIGMRVTMASAVAPMGPMVAALEVTKA